jgi:FkbM family methyltransferase
MPVPINNGTLSINRSMTTTEKGKDVIIRQKIYTYAFLRLSRLLTNAGIPVPRRYKLAAMAPETGLFDGYVGKYYMLFDFQNVLQRSMFFGSYDSVEIRLFQKVLKPGDVFLDAGAHVGYYSLIASQIVSHAGSVHAFEPMPWNVSRLQQTIKMNNISNIAVNQVAVGSREDTIQLYYQGTNNMQGASMIPSIRRESALDVAQITLDEYVRSSAIDHVALIKLDIEGAEPHALLGMKDLISRTDAPHIMCEIAPHFLEPQGLNSLDITRHLADHGYNCYRIDTKYIADISSSFYPSFKFLLKPLNPDCVIGHGEGINLFATKDKSIS